MHTLITNQLPTFARKYPPCLPEIGYEKLLKTILEFLAAHTCV